MSHEHGLSPVLRESTESTLSQEHHYNSVNISGNARPVLGNVYHFHNTTPRDVGSEESLKTIRDELAYPEMNSRFLSLNEPYPDTFKWIFSSPDTKGTSSRRTGSADELLWDSFTDWLNEGSDPYWISGKLGSGKSTLVKFLMENLQDRESAASEGRNHVAISHFFWEAGSELQKSISGCVRSLIWQLLESVSSENETAPVQKSNLRSSAGLLKFLNTLLGSLNQRLIIFLDGLDECRETEDVLDLVEVLSAHKCVKLCISSRPEEMYRLNFATFPKLKLQDLNKADIEHIIIKALLENPRVQRSKTWDAKTAQELAEVVISKAEGVVLWVKLVVKDLIRGWTNCDDIERMQKRLESLPSDIYKLFTGLRERSDGSDVSYDEDAAFYYHLLAEDPQLTLPLHSFHFALRDPIRARFLDTDTIFDRSLAEIEADIDCELVATWLNVRTGGLLEVRQQGDIFRLASRWHSFPPGLHMQFASGWVQHVHRSAYTYLTDTHEGKQLLKKCIKSLDEIKTIYFQSQLVTHFILPGMYRFRPGTNLLRHVFPHVEGYATVVSDCLAVLQRVLDSLLSQDLILAIQDWHVVGNRSCFPSSAYRRVDVCLYFCSLGRSAIVDALIREYGCQNDHEYMAKVHIINLFRTPWDIQNHLRNLCSHVQDLNAVELTVNKEHTCIAKSLATSAMNRDSTDRAIFWKLLRDNHVNFDPRILPLCEEIFYAYKRANVFGPEKSLVFVSLAIKTMEAWSELQDMGKYSSVGYSLFFVTSCDTVSEIRVIAQADSNEVLEILRLMAIDKSRDGTAMMFAVHGIVPFEVTGSKSLQAIFERSLVVQSFVDCLRKLGKHDEAIDHMVGRFVDYAKYGYSRYSTDPHYDPISFQELLGRDAESLKHWCQMFPDLIEHLAFEKEDLERRKKFLNPEEPSGSL